MCCTYNEPSSLKHGGRRPGFTLAEVLVAAALGLLVLGMTTRLLVPSARYLARGSATANAQRVAAMTIARLQQDLARSSGLGVKLASADGMSLISIQPTDDVTPDAQLVWQPRVVLYVWHQKQRRLTRGWRDLPADTSLEHPADLDTQSLVQLAGQSTDPVLATGVVDFSLTHAGATLVESPISLRIGLSGGYSLTQTLTLRTPNS